MFETPPTIREPSKAEIEAYAERHFIGLSDEELDAMWEYAKTVVDDTAILDELEQPSPPRADYADRDPGYKPGKAEDPHNIYVTKCLVESDNTGPLSGYDVGIKDNIAVAGVEMTCGSKSMEGYVPSFDATLVKRLLDAGASITGKLNMGEFGGSGSGELSAFGPILIPDHPNHLAGGSSGGSAAAVAAGEVDVAIGADQAGSIRIPGALCGVVGLKPTHGLVPYTGAAGWGHSFDHAGPMSDSVADSARVLETIAGADPFDPRQSHVETQNYTEHLDRDLDEFSIGVLKEGFGHDVSDPAVDDTVRAAVDHMEDRGAEVEEISIPLHEHAPSIWFAMVMASSTTLFHTEGVGRFGKGYYDAQFAQAFGKARRTMADEWSICVKTQMVLGEYLEKEYLGRYHAKAQNLRLPLTRQFDEALDDVDAIVMPTMPVTAHEVEADLTLPEVIDRAWSIFPNTPTNDLTGHPAITVPCGTVDGLPVGLQITGGTFDDATVLALADAFERSIE